MKKSETNVTIKSVSSVEDDSINRYSEKDYFDQKKKRHLEKIDSNRLLAKSIVFSSILISGVMLFAIINYFNVNWYFPSIIYLTIIVIAENMFFRMPEIKRRKDNNR